MKGNEIRICEVCGENYVKEWNIYDKEKEHNLCIVCFVQKVAKKVKEKEVKLWI